MEAARYVGVGATTFDALVDKGEMPPARWGLHWSRATLDAWLKQLPLDPPGPWPVEPCVYFLCMERAPYVKVGHATRIATRRLDLQVGNPERLLLLATLPGSLQDESSFHRALGPFRSVGEWFHSGIWVDEVLIGVGRREGTEAILNRIRATR